MNRKNILIYTVLLISMISLAWIKPLVPDFFDMNIWGKLVYIVLMYGFPLYIIIPIGIMSSVLLLTKANKPNYFIKVKSLTRKIYMPISVIILVINLTLLISKRVFNNDQIYPLVEYSSIKGTYENIEDIREGTFYGEGVEVHRTKSQEIVLFNSKQDTIIYELEWISNNEYDITFDVENHWMDINSTRVIITNNNPEFYEGYQKHGDYASYFKVYKTFTNNIYTQEEFQ